MSDYWVAEWLRERGLTSWEAARIRIATDDGLDSALAAAEDAQALPDVPAGKNFVAGTGSDLTTRFACNDIKCLKATVDKLVRQTWLFFDHVIVVGLDPQDFLLSASQDREDAREKLATAVEVYLYIRDADVTEFFHFRRDMRLCTEHLNQHALEAGLSPVDEMVKLLRREFKNGGKLKVIDTSSGRKWVFRHPALSTVSIGKVPPELSTAKLKNRVIERQARGLVASYTRSVSLARRSRATLGQFALETSKVKLASAANRVEVGEVALNVAVPLFHDAPIGQLLSFRAAEREEFEIFRSALSKAIKERLANVEEPDAVGLAKEIVEDVLNPAIASLTLRSQKSARILGARSAGSLAVGGLMTTVGLMQFTPLILPGLVLATGAAVANYAEYLKDRREVDLNELHFLWRAGSTIHG
ncbi:hypothetical protein [Microlunatus sagamiharensis]|uniref:hypothetical protein n=1 Tax=Microlunatus sagamiharensis TaxID=546874 RepID=UPI0012FE1955|nr:hypothetical protein [Microlunatus sagamiharensis]